MNTDKIWAEAIAKDYAPKDNSKIIALKKLDRQARLPAVIFAYSFGIITTLVAGLGMCLAMQILGSGASFVVMGVMLGLLGFTGCGVNYLMYKKLLERGKQKYAFEIVELAREISEQTSM